MEMAHTGAFLQLLASSGQDKRVTLPHYHYLSQFLTIFSTVDELQSFQMKFYFWIQDFTCNRKQSIWVNGMRCKVEFLSINQPVCNKELLHSRQCFFSVIHLSESRAHSRCVFIT